MNIDEYRYAIVSLLRRDDAIRAGTLLRMAADCVLWCSENGYCEDQTEQLEKAAGVWEETE